LTKRQFAVIDDLFAGEMDEQEVLDKHGVRRRLYERWLADERFCEEFETRIARAHRAGRVILARYAPLAAGKLVELTQCDKEETVRKACLDIISMFAPDATGSAAPQPDEHRTEDLQLPPETASRILAALAAEPVQNETGI
jgi:hypothetical protein